MTVHLRHREIHEKTPIELFMSAAQASGVVAITAAAAHAVMEPVMAGSGRKVVFISCHMTLVLDSVARAVSRTFPIVWIISIPVFYLNRRSACRREAAMERLKDSAESFNLMNVESLAPKLDGSLCAFLYPNVKQIPSQPYHLVPTFCQYENSTKPRGWMQKRKQQGYSGAV